VASDSVALLPAAADAVDGNCALGSVACGISAGTGADPFAPLLPRSFALSLVRWSGAGADCCSAAVVAAVIAMATRRVAFTMAAQ